MSYYTPEEMKTLLKEYPQYADRLYCRGFLLTTKRFENLSDYPFYSNWKEQIVSCGTTTYYLYTHFETYSYLYEADNQVFFIIGHAYDPFHMITDENDLLHDMAESLLESEDAYWDRESDLTGVFCTGYLSEKEAVYTTDCCGMQLVNHGVVKENLFVSSHSKLVADLENLQQPKYIQKLVNSRFWKYFGMWLPGDLSPYEELRRLSPNFFFSYNVKSKTEKGTRFYPMHKIVEVKSMQEYEKTILELSDIMSKTMKCIAKKWSDRKVSVSVTGGRDSLTALACANGFYDKFSYFSYISNADEAVDANAAKKILDAIGQQHELFVIPKNIKENKDIDVFKKILECNAGCIGNNNVNDVKKRLYFYLNPPCDMEVKSWVNEMGRGWYQNKFNKKNFPRYPYASYWRAIHKVYISPYLIHKTNGVFREYLKKYYDKDTFDRMSWLELYFWEFAWSGGEGVFLTCEQRVSYDITIPFNNRKYVGKMLTVPIEKREVDDIPNDIIAHMESRIHETGVSVKDVSHTDRRAFLERVHLEIASKLVF